MTTKKALVLCTFLFSIPLSALAQSFQGKVITDTIYSENLENRYGENPNRAVSVYLPPGYDNSNQRYPVIYFLHGFTSDHQIITPMADLLDFAIETHRIRPFILVVPNERTTYDGSFYSNSQLFGNWEDFTAYDLVNYMDRHYRTLDNRDSRGITGHSMGGYGALKIAMHHPEIFSSVYALSPGVLAIVREYGPNSNTYKEFAAVKTQEDLNKIYFGKLVVALGKSWSPNPDHPPFYCDMPFEYRNGELVVNREVLDKWYKNMPFYMIDDNLDNLKKLKAIKLDWGRNAGDRFTIQCSMFSQRLENVGITHFAEEYIGTHVNNIFTRDGRIPNQLLPFFDLYLDFGQAGVAYPDSDKTLKVHPNNTFNRGVQAGTFNETQDKKVMAAGQSEERPSVFLEELTWVEVADFIRNGGTSVIVPTGGTEQNGPHMDIGKHNFRVTYMAERIARELGDALVAPTIAYVPEGNIDPPEGWMKFPGTISLPEDQFIKLLEYTCRSLKQHGFIDIFLIGDSGENQQGMKAVSEALNEEWKDSETKVHFVSDYYGVPYTQVYDSLVASGISEDVLGFHAGVIDVSFLMAIDPSRVRRDRLLQSDLDPEKKLEMGFTGDPSKANIEIGKRMIQKTLEISLSQIQALKVSDRSPVAGYLEE